MARVLEQKSARSTFSPPWRELSQSFKTGKLNAKRKIKDCGEKKLTMTAAPAAATKQQQNSSISLSQQQHSSKKTISSE